MEEKVSFYFKNVEPTNAMKQYTLDKLQKLEKMFHHIEGIDVRFSLTEKKQCFEVTIHADALSFHVQKVNEDMYAAIDKSLDVLHNLVDARHKKVKTSQNNDMNLNLLLPLLPDRGELPDENEIEVFDVPHKPMHDEEAILQLRRQRYRFMMYRNLERDEKRFSLVFLRSDGNYSVISPTKTLERYEERVYKEGSEVNQFKEVKLSEYPLSVLSISEAIKNLYKNSSERIAFVNQNTLRMNILFHSRSGGLVIKRPAA